MQANNNFHHKKNQNNYKIPITIKNMEVVESFYNKLVQEYKIWKEFTWGCLKGKQSKT